MPTTDVPEPNRRTESDALRALARRLRREADDDRAETAPAVGAKPTLEDVLRRGRCSAARFCCRFATCRPKGYAIAWPHCRATFRWK
ncbi:MAG: hypothetical protein QM775_24415 [Pirellulales bacterium]